MPDSDRDQLALQLLTSIARGDKAAMEDFYGLFEKNIYAFAQSRLNDPHAAADIVNEVMMAVWRTADRFQGKSKVQTWLLGIAHHKVVDILRKRNARTHEELVDEIPDVSSETGERIVVAAQQSETVQRCLEKLTDQHRQVVHLAFFEELSYMEIAGIVDCPPGTVKTRMFHAKNSLKRCLERMGLTGEQI